MVTPRLAALARSAEEPHLLNSRADIPSNQIIFHIEMLNLKAALGLNQPTADLDMCEG